MVRTGHSSSVLASTPTPGAAPQVLRPYQVLGHPVSNPGPRGDWGTSELDSPRFSRSAVCSSEPILSGIYWTPAVKGQSRSWSSHQNAEIKTPSKFSYSLRPGAGQGPEAEEEEQSGLAGGARRTVRAATVGRSQLVQLKELKPEQSWGCGGRLAGHSELSAMGRERGGRQGDGPEPHPCSPLEFQHGPNFAGELITVRPAVSRDLRHSAA